MFKKNIIAIPILLAMLITGCIDLNGEENDKPKASIVANNTTIFQGELINFNGNGSYDLDGEIMEFKWDFADGSYDNNVICSHRFQNAGTFNVTLTVRDDKGSYGSTTIMIIVKKVVNSLPIAIANIFVEQSTIYQGDNIRFEASDSYDTDGTIINYEWEIGTGLIYDDEIFNFIYNTPGEYDISLAVEDNNHTIGYDNFTITIEPAIEINILDHENREGWFVEEYYWIKIEVKNYGGKYLDLSDSDITYFWITAGADTYEGYISSGEDEIGSYSTDQKELDFDYFPIDSTPDKLIFKYNDDYKYEVYIT